MAISAVCYDENSLASKVLGTAKLKLLKFGTDVLPINLNWRSYNMGTQFFPAVVRNFPPEFKKLSPEEQERLAAAVFYHMIKTENYSMEFPWREVLQLPK